MIAPPPTLAPAPPGVDPDLAYLYDENGVFYPEADGEPMPDAGYQDHTIRAARFQLDHHYRHRPGTLVSGNTLLYYEQGNPRRVVSPDCYVAFDVDLSIMRYRTYYTVWDMGKPPDFTLEVASKSTHGNDTGAKMRIYSGMGVGEYWLFDKSPDGEYYGFRLAGYRLVNGDYQSIAVAEDRSGNLSGYSATLGLDIRWEYDADLEEGRIRLYDPLAGAYLLDYEQALYAIDDADAARNASDAARIAAETAQQQTETALRASETARIAAETEAAALREQIRLLQAQAQSQSPTNPEL